MNDESKLPFEEKLKNIISESFEEINSLSSLELLERCRKKPHITNLPYDNRTNDPSKLAERQSAIEDKLEELDKQIEEYDKSLEEDLESAKEDVDGAFDIIDDVVGELEREFGEEDEDGYLTDGSQQEWEERGLGKEYDYIYTNLMSILADIGELELNVPIEDFMAYDMSLSLDEIRDRLDKLQDYMQNTENGIEGDVPEALPYAIERVSETWYTISSAYETIAYSYMDSEESNAELKTQRADLEEELNKINI